MNFYVWKEIVGKRQDRLIAFFDAILAIAITVLALEITVPSIGNIGQNEQEDFFISFTCYLISFIAMSLLWYIHNHFFSNYSLTGSHMEIILHLVLLFVITLFQPLTRAIGLYGDDHYVRFMYLADFILMNAFNIGIMFLVKRNNKKLDKKNSEIKNLFINSVLKSDKPLNEDMKLLMTVYSLNNPDKMLELLKEHMPEEYAEILKEQENAQRQSYKLALLSTVEALLFIIAAVITLMYSIPGCYTVLAAGLAVIFLTNRFVKRSSGKKN